MWFSCWKENGERAFVQKPRLGMFGEDMIIGFGM
jgi:hypothetical protein